MKSTSAASSLEIVGAEEVAFERETALVDGVPIAFTAGGVGEPVVFVHGLCGSSNWWSPTMALARGRRIYLLDLPGFGAFGHLGRHFALATAGEWIRKWMDAVGLDEASVVGHSMGAHIALRLAIAHPARVRRLALVAPAGIVPVRSALGHWSDFFRAARLSSRPFLRVLARDVLRARRSTWTAAARELAGQDLRADLGDVSMPTLIVCGGLDPLVPAAVGRLLERTIPSARLLVLDGAGHVPMFEEAALLNDALDTFLADAGGSVGPARERAADPNVRKAATMSPLPASVPAM